MSFVGKMFGFGKPEAPAPKPDVPKPTPPAPRIGDAEVESVSRAERARLKRRRGIDDTVLTGLGDVGGMAPVATTQRSSLLGGG